ncbi:MAG: hypothetical protein LBE92_05625 [Chryseobacterium sp.]|jgi:hypothetical protein|nr:hypothetical protein [Chryseobacterium sp.]
MNRTSIKDHENLLQVFMILLNEGLIPTAMISEWADGILASEEESDYVFIELSTVRDVHDLSQILRKNSAEADPEICSRAVLGILFQLLNTEKVTFKKAFETATHISYEESLSSDEQFLLYRFYDYRDFHSDERYESQRLFKSNFLELLGLYKDFSLDHYEKWPEINEMLKTNLQNQLEVIKKQYPY